MTGDPTVVVEGDEECDATNEASNLPPRFVHPFKAIPQPKTYNIEKLLGSAIQPFNDLTAEELTALATDIQRGRRLAVPVIISKDGILIDGSQRLGVLHDKGVRAIHEDDVRIVDYINRGNALEWAIRLNARRRNVSVEDKARAARTLRAEKKWGWAKIAKEFNVTRQAIQQWLGATEDPDIPEPIEITGEDGKTYKTPIPEQRAKKLPKDRDPHPWSERGDLTRKVSVLSARLRGALRDEIGDQFKGLCDDEITAVKVRLMDLAEVIDVTLVALGVESDDVRDWRERVAVEMAGPDESDLETEVAG